MLAAPFGVTKPWAASYGLQCLMGKRQSEPELPRALRNRVSRRQDRSPRCCTIPRSANSQNALILVSGGGGAVVR